MDKLIEAVDELIAARENWQSQWSGTMGPGLDAANDRLDDAFSKILEIRRQMRETPE